MDFESPVKTPAVRTLALTCLVAPRPLKWLEFVRSRDRTLFSFPYSSSRLDFALLLRASSRRNGLPSINPVKALRVEESPIL